MAEDIGSVYPTKIPGLEEPADIQAALKLYHYGSATVPSTINDVEPNSIAGHIKALDSRVDSVELTGVGSTYSSTEPVSPVDGFIWVNSNISAATIAGSVAIYQNDAPSTNLVDGLLWVDKNSSPLKMYVYDLTTTTWKEIGA